MWLHSCSIAGWIRRRLQSRVIFEDGSATWLGSPLDFRSVGGLSLESHRAVRLFVCPFDSQGERILPADPFPSLSPPFPRPQLQQVSIKRMTTRTNGRAIGAPFDGQTRANAALRWARWRHSLFSRASAPNAMATANSVIGDECATRSASWPLSHFPFESTAASSAAASAGRRRVGPIRLAARHGAGLFAFSVLASASTCGCHIAHPPSADAFERR